VLLRVIYFFLIVVVGTAGELCVSRAMKEAGEVHDFRPGALLGAAGRVLRIKWIWIGVGLMTLGFFALLGILSIENVSFVVPVTALSYVVGGLGGMLFLGERPSPSRWLGILLVCVGVALVVVGNR
jgi:drug/metabolite transporter (DMT)-like permease